MEFDGLLGNLELGGRLLVQESGGDPRKHFAFALGQSLKPAAQFGQIHSVAAKRSSALDRLVDGSQQNLTIDRLLQKIDRTVLHGPNAYVDSPESCEEDNA